MFPPAAFPHLFPGLLDLGPPGLAVHIEVVAGLPVAPAALPAPVRRELMHPPAQVVSRGRTPRQGLVVTAREGLALVTELLSEFLALRRAVTPPAVDVVHYPLAYPRGPRLGDPSGHVGKVGLAEVSPRDGASQVLRRTFGSVVGNLVPLDAEVNWGSIVTSGGSRNSSGSYTPR